MISKKHCGNCKYCNLLVEQEPCASCIKKQVIEPSNWTPVTK